MKDSIFIFFNDLRVVDNTAWNMAEQFKPFPIVFLQKFPNNRVRDFYMSAVKDLEVQLDLPLLITDSIKQFPTKGIKHVFYNKDPAYPDHDKHVVRWAKLNNIQVTAPTTDYSLLDFQKLDRPYKVFSNFYKTFAKHQVLAQTPTTKIHKNTRFGGRSDALNILKNKTSFKSYVKTRDIVSQPTTMLSAYMNCGCVSVREVWHAFRGNEPLIRQLFWREFYQQLVYFFPQLVQGAAFYPQRDKSTWTKHRVQAWENGASGIPLIDASMRCLKQTGFLHNRCRMVVASYLVKDLGVDWRVGEAYFKSQLTDYYFPSNNGGWQFISGTGASSMMQSRKFNPYIQSKKYDPDATFIKQWVPELADVLPNFIHKQPI